jgi:ferredoxin
MTSPRSEEVKLGAEKPLEPEEVKRCELKPTMEIKRTACIRCGGCVPTGPIASCHLVKEKKVSTPV